MRDIGLFFRTEIEKRGLQQKILALKCGYSEAHFWQLIQKEDMKCSRYEKICRALGVSPMSVFDVDDEHSESLDTRVSEGSEDVKSMKALLKERQKRIDALEEALASTKELLSVYRDKIGTDNSQK